MKLDAIIFGFFQQQVLGFLAYNYLSIGQCSWTKETSER